MSFASSPSSSSAPSPSAPSPDLASRTVDLSRNTSTGSPATRYLLLLEAGASRVFELPESGEVVAGRGETAQLRLVDSSISRAHAKLHLAPDDAVIEDLGSQNGTYVNDERISGKRKLLPGDVIALSGSTMVFYAPPRKRPGTLLDAGAFHARGADELDRARRFQRPLALVLVSLGCRAETSALGRAVAGVLNPSEVMAPLGEDLLAVLLPEATPELARESAQGILEALESLAPGAKAALATCPENGFDLQTLIAVSRSLLTTARPGETATSSPERYTRTFGDRTIVIADPAMIRVYELVSRLAKSDLPVLINGETGTGKELVAFALHQGSPRHKGPLATLNCAALPDTLLEAELFGYEKGAFTGATAAKAGRFEAAQGGTVFLDEVGELSATAQAKLLRALETGTISRLGEVRERKIDIRIVAATHRNLRDEVAAGRFREDLYFRLCGATLWLPPLRDRQSELPILARRFLAEACAKLGREELELSPGALHRLASHPWPGNLRELRNVMSYVAATVAEDVVEPWHLNPQDAAPGPSHGPSREAHASKPGSTANAGIPRPQRPLQEEVAELERARMAEALELCNGNQRKAAETIGMPLRTFVTKLGQYNLRSQQTRGVKAPGAEGGSGLLPS